MERRSFLRWATHGLGALFGVLLGVPALAFLIDARNRKAPEGAYRTVARLKDLQKDVPFQVVLRDVRWDAWTLHPSDVIGRVWLIRRDNDKVEAFTTICPHLGCSVNFEDKSQLFICPCHGGTFNLAGERVERPDFNNPAPRGMDHLECRRDPNDPESVQVHYQNFRQGEPTPELKG
jgi:Rieske Fe-S protein